MSRAASLSESIDRTLTGEQWHGPAVGVLVRDVDEARASAHPIPHAHSIWEIVLHVTTWARVVHTRLGGTAFEPRTDEEDWPPVTDSSADAWRRALDELASAHTRLRDAVAGISDEQLAAPAPGRPHSMHAMVRGAIDHAIYHGGQVALLKRALGPQG